MEVQMIPVEAIRSDLYHHALDAANCDDCEQYDNYKFDGRFATGECLGDCDDCPYVERHLATWIDEWIEANEK